MRRKKSLTAEQAPRGGEGGVDCGDARPSPLSFIILIAPQRDVLFGCTVCNGLFDLPKNVR